MNKTKIIVLFLFVIIILFVFFLANKVSFNNLEKGDFVQDKTVLSTKNYYVLEDSKPFISENHYASPVWAPNSKSVAFTDLNYKGIFIKNIADGKIKKVSDDEGAGFRNCWSNDSKEIVYLSRKIINGNSFNTIKLVDIETGEINSLTNGEIGVSLPTFTKENDIIYSFKGKLILRQRIVNQTTCRTSYSKGKVLAENVPANFIIQSPKSNKLIVEDDEGIRIMSIDGTNKKNIVKNNETDFAYGAKVSIDGSKVLFSNNVGAIGHLYIYDIQNEKTTSLGEGYLGQWLPNDKIIYCIPKNDGNIIIDSELYIINSSGTFKNKITETPNRIELQPAVSPDGKSIIYEEDKSKKIFIGILNCKN